MIERSQLEKILKEHELSVSGVVQNPDYELLGRILPVDTLVVGSVTNFGQWHDAFSWGATVTFSARMVNIRNGEVLFLINCIANGNNWVAKQMAQLCARDAVKKLVNK